MAVALRTNGTVSDEVLGLRLEFGDSGRRLVHKVIRLFGFPWKTGEGNNLLVSREAVQRLGEVNVKTLLPQLKLPPRRAQTQSQRHSSIHPPSDGTEMGKCTALYSKGCASWAQLMASRPRKTTGWWHASTALETCFHSRMYRGVSGRVHVGKEAGHAIAMTPPRLCGDGRRVLGVGGAVR